MFRVKLGPFKYELVRGEWLEFGGSRMIPIARIFSFNTRKAFIGMDRVSGTGAQYVSIHPVGIIDERAGVRRLMLAPDWTRRISMGVAILVLIEFLVSRGVASGMRERRQRHIEARAG